MSKNPAWQDKISHHSQLGGIETSVLDNGAGKGVRIAWFNTGKLRFKVVLDRGMDIMEAFFQEHSLAWISHQGTAAPQPFSNQGIDWLRTFGGGLLTTCGLSHAGVPDSDEFGQRGLHGNISNIPATISSIKQPDIRTGDLEMSISGKMIETSVFGPTLEWKRTISCKLGENSIRIRDEVLNLGNTPAPHMLLYHINCGWPLIDVGSDIVWNGSFETFDKYPGNPIFTPNNDFKKCPAPMDSHSGFGESVAFIRPQDEVNGVCRCGFVNQNLGIGLEIAFSKHQLPWLINWQHWGKGEYVTALEPATHPPIGQAKARMDGTLIFLEPGEKRGYDLAFQMLNTPESISNLLEINNK
jgi:hypothetical protein